MILKPLRPVLSPIARSVAGAVRGRLSSPSLMLEFAGEAYSMGAVDAPLSARAFNDLITFTRASGGGRRNAQGQYEWLPANTPRIDYDPVTGECRGLLIEEQRTNLLTYSSDFANAVWTKVGATITTGAFVAPDAKAASKLVESTENSSHALFSSTTITNGVSHTVSFVVKAAGRNNVRIRLAATSNGLNGTFLADANFDLLAGTYLSGTNAGNSIAHLGSGWYRISVTATSTSTTIGAALMLGTSVSTVAYQGNGTSGIYIWGAQLEAGSFPTSYIPTTTAQVTRAADVASMNVLSPWFNASEGTLFAEWVQPQQKSGQQTVFDLNDGTVNNRIAGLIESSSTVFQSRYASAGSILPNKSAPTAAPGTRCRAALSFSMGVQEFAFNGAIFGSGNTVGTLGLVQALRIGGGLGGQLNSHIRSIRYFPKRLSNAELQSLTAN